MMAMDSVPKVLVTKIGFDGHDRGSRVVAAGCATPAWRSSTRRPGRRSPRSSKLAIEEDVDVIGISSLATDHLIVPKLMDALREAGLGDVGVIVGGIVPDEDENMLLDAGVAHVFHSGHRARDIAAYIRDVAGMRAAARRPQPEVPP